MNYHHYNRHIYLKADVIPQYKKIQRTTAQRSTSQFSDTTTYLSIERTNDEQLQFVFAGTGQRNS